MAYMLHNAQYITNKSVRQPHTSTMAAMIHSQGSGDGGTASNVVEVDNLKKLLFRAAMQGKWEKVVKIYTENRSVQAEKITRSEDTVLHVAVSDGRTAEVKRLVDAVALADAHRILGQENEKGNTPLHLAAAMGMVEACAAMAKKSPELVINARNNRGETPLFVSAKYGKKTAFFALQDAIDTISPPVHDLSYSYCRKQDGDTILHAAISREHFDVALEIINMYDPLVNFYNQRGESALHWLANKPYVFKSGSRYSLLDSIIYHCTFVDPLKVKYPKFKGKAYSDCLETKKGSDYLPMNWKTCYDVFELLKHLYNTLISTFQHRSRKKCFIADEEDPDVGHLKHSQVDGHLVTSQGATDASDSKPQNQETHELQNGSSDDQRLFPENYRTLIDIFKLVMKFLLVILGIGFWRKQEIAKKKRKHIHACQIMDELIKRSLSWEYDKDGKRPEKRSLSLPQTIPSTDDAGVDISSHISNSMLEEPQNTNTNINEKIKKEQQGGASIMVATKGDATGMLKKILENFSLAVKQDGVAKNIVILGMDEETSSKEPDGATPILVAAKRGVTEMVERILDNFPIAVQDMDSDDKNIVLTAVEHRQPQVYTLMLERSSIMKESVFGKVDKEGNSALHLAATLAQDRPWIIPGAALQMQWEIKWYKFVLKSMGLEFFPQYNYKGETAREIFTKKHEQLVKDGGSWLSNTSQSCSVVAALIATVAFASATTVPGGVNQDSGFPTLEKQPAFEVFAISALIALCFSVTSLIMFLAILTSRYLEWDFQYDLPVKLILGLTSLFMSITAMLVSFCAGHFFVVEKELKFVTYPIYAVMCLPVTFFAVAQLPLYIDLIQATFADVPERTEKIRAFT